MNPLMVFLYLGQLKLILFFCMEDLPHNQDIHVYHLIQGNDLGD